MRYYLASALLLAASACSGTTAEPADNISSDVKAGAYHVEVATGGVAQAGATSDLSIHVFDPSNQPVTTFDDLHTQVMHVVAVSSDLNDFQHVHPTPASDGTLSVSIPLASAQPYDVFFEYDPSGPATEQTNRAKLIPEGAREVPPRLGSSSYFGGSRPLTSTAGDTKIELKPVAQGMLMPNMATSMRIEVKTATGAPATDLVEWLGMMGHAILLSEDRSTFIHAHAMPPGMGHDGMGHDGMDGMNDMPEMPGHTGQTSSMPSTTTASNVLDINVNLPKAGFYKMFVQVKRRDAVVTVPFVLRVMSM